MNLANVAEVLLVILSSCSCIGALAVMVGQRLRTVRRRMAIDLRPPRSREVLCDRDLDGWQPLGGDQ